MTGFLTLLYKELLRFWKVGFQTIMAPIVSTLLYLLIFFHVLEAHVEIYPGIAYTIFLIPGLVMMAVIQNAFANSSSSIIQSKISGNIVFILLSPLSYHAIFLAYILAAIARGLLVGLGVHGTDSVYAAVSADFLSCAGSARGNLSGYRLHHFSDSRPRHDGGHTECICQLIFQHHSVKNQRQYCIYPAIATVLSRNIFGLYSGSHCAGAAGWSGRLSGHSAIF